MPHNRFFDKHQRDTIAARYGLDDPDRRHAGRTAGGDQPHRKRVCKFTNRTIRPVLVSYYPHGWWAKERPPGAKCAPGQPSR
jgi:hypothetical protein